MDLLNLVQGIDAAELQDLTEVSSGGGRGLLPSGTAFVRFAGYIELGSHSSSYMGETKAPKPKFQLLFRIVGGTGTNQNGEQERYVLEEGMFPQLKTFPTDISTFEKAKCFKIFTAMNTAPQVTHFSHLLGRLYLLPIGTKKNKEGKVVQNIDYTKIVAAIDPVSGVPYSGLPELKKEDYKVFLWNKPTNLTHEQYKAMWDSLYIEGQWEAQKDDAGNVTKPAKSRNEFQDTCLKATDYIGSSLERLMAEVGGAVVPALATQPEAHTAQPVPSPTVPEVPSVPVVPSVPEVPSVPVLDEVAI